MASDDVASFIRKLSDHIGKNWKKVARELKFSQTDVHAIEYSGRDDLKEQIHLFFEEWKMREGKSATVKMLVDALKEARLQGILDELNKPESTGREKSSEMNVAPVQESSQGAANNASPTKTTEIERMRQKRLKKLLSNDSSQSSPKYDVSSEGVSRSMSDPSSSAGSGEHATTDSPKAKRLPTFEVGDVVKVESFEPRPWYGVIRWIGSIKNPLDKVAGIEMEDKVKGGHSGDFKGKSYFKCEDGCGIFLPLSRLKPDDRFDPPSLIQGATPTGEEAEKDRHRPSASPRSKSSSAGFKEVEDIFSAIASLHVSPSKEMPKLDDTSAFPDGASGNDSGLEHLVFQCPGDRAGFIIGKDGKNVHEVESETNTKIDISPKRGLAENVDVVIIGRKENCKKALLKILTNIRRKTAVQIAATETIEIQNRKMCGRVIGKNGANRKAIENISGARIKIEESTGLEAMLDPNGPRKCKITGSAEQIESAKELMELAQEGADIAQAAQIAAVWMIELAMRELTKEGFSFPDNLFS